MKKSGGTQLDPFAKIRLPLISTVMGTRLCVAGKPSGRSHYPAFITSFTLRNPTCCPRLSATPDGVKDWSTAVYWF